MDLVSNLIIRQRGAGGGLLLPNQRKYEIEHWLVIIKSVLPARSNSQGGYSPQQLPPATSGRRPPVCPLAAPTVSLK